MDPTAFVTPCLLAGAALYALRQRVDVFSALTHVETIVLLQKKNS